MSKIRIAVIGAEGLDPDHHLALNTLTQSGRIEALALDVACDDAGLLALEQAVRTNTLDAVVIAGQQAELPLWIQAALASACPVYSTYPVPFTIEDMIEIRRAEQTARTAFVQFGLTVRHHDSITTALSKADSGEYGNLLSMRAVCGTDGSHAETSLMHGVAAQIIDVMQAFAGPFQDVNGFADLDRTDEPGSEHNIIATLRTHSGTIASLHVSRTQWRPTFRLELGYERGYLWMEGLATEAHAFGQEALIYARTDGGETRHETVDRFEESNGALVALSGFVERILHPNAPILGTSQDAFDTLNTAQRVLAADPILSLSQERHAS